MIDSDSIVLPIFICERGGLLAFEEVVDAERYLEPVDVAAGEYPRAFDAIGRLLNIVVKREALRCWARPFVQDRVVITLSSASVVPGEFRHILATALSAVGAIEPDVPAALEDLVQMARHEFAT